MEFQIKTTPAATSRSACLILGVFEKRKLTAAAVDVDKASGGALGKLLRKGDFNGKQGQTLLIYDVPGVTASRVMLLGLGVEKECNAEKLSQALACAVKQLNDSQVTEALFTLPERKHRPELYADARDCAIATIEAGYRFDTCKSDAEPPKHPLRRLNLLANHRRDATTLEHGVAHGKAIAGGMSLAKDLANLPGNICTPSYLAEQARQVGRGVRKLKVSVLEEKDMEKLGMGALLSVSKGSREPAKLIVMEYKGGKPGGKPVALVGKGLTFDAGGISIKPGANMDEMKYDMCGGASVIGTLAACVELALPINVVGVVPSSENLPDGQANKPGDIVTSMSGQTIEILNTDAEGRLILCDALTYTERFEPDAVIDIATLTGACIVALGDQASGLLSNNDKLADDLLAAGQHTADRAWRLPLWEEYQSQLDSNFADMANIGGRGAGTITAACFLARYTKKFKWAHLDIAGTAWKTGKEKGATGRPVPMLMQYLLKRCRLSH